MSNLKYDALTEAGIERGRVPAMLNFTAGIRNLRAAVKLAGVKRVLTSHRFIEQGKLHDIIDALERLRADDLMVGVISHVPQMAAQIKSGLEVHKRDGGSVITPVGAGL